MKFKTLALFEKYERILKEQDGTDPNAQQTQEQQPQDVQDAVDPNAQAADETVPLTSQGEDRYISDLIDAALFSPSSEDSKTLLNLQNVMQMKRYKNAREEVLPLVLSIISPETQAGDIKQDLNTI